MVSASRPVGAVGWDHAILFAWSNFGPSWYVFQYVDLFFLYKLTMSEFFMPISLLNLERENSSLLAKYKRVRLFAKLKWRFSLLPQKVRWEKKMYVSFGTHCLFSCKSQTRIFDLFFFLPFA